MDLPKDSWPSMDAVLQRLLGGNCVLSGEPNLETSSRKLKKRTTSGVTVMLLVDVCCDYVETPAGLDLLLISLMVLDKAMAGVPAAVDQAQRSINGGPFIWKNG